MEVVLSGRFVAQPSIKYDKMPSLDFEGFK